MGISRNIEIWGGVECTINRVGDEYFNQLEVTGHDVRLEDLSEFKKIGFSAIRYPVLWEQVSPNSFDEFDWSWTDARLSTLRELGITPIVTLLHHGSGPKYTSLLDPKFPELFATFAANVARRYSWIKYFCPINEPLTTARFSALYGHWYPHRKNDLDFITAFFNQLEGIVRAMTKIREIIPDAKLVQTEDFGKMLSTHLLRYQADYENARRWLTWDTLIGDPCREEAIRSCLEYLKFPQSRFTIFHNNPTPPDIIGINHYVTSTRYIDHRIENFPSHLRGTNGFHNYVDIEAVRACPFTPSPFDLFNEVWTRYKLPIAATEVHLGCAEPEEQLRWFSFILESLETLRNLGADVRAITTWSLVGAVDWDSLLTKRRGHYESGAFRITEHGIEMTALGEMIRSLISSRQRLQNHEPLDYQGWWEDPKRILYVLEDI